MISGKVWGDTRLIKSNPNFEVHIIHVKEGGKCSLHCHKHKVNGFYVIEGQLAIDVEKQDYALIDHTNLVPGDYMEVQAGEFHRFHALTDVTALEIYYVDFDPNDIVRRDVGSA